MHFTCDCDRCIHAKVCRFIDVLSCEKVQEAERAIDAVNFPEYIKFHMVCGAFKEDPDA